MKFFFTAYDFPGIISRLKELGHEVVSEKQWGDGSAQTDAWWNWMKAGKSPREYSDHLTQRVADTGADVVVIGKGWHFWKGNTWSLELSALEALKRKGVKLVYLSWDDPDQIPMAVASRILGPMDVIGTCCLDRQQCIVPYRKAAPYAELFLFWPGWDQTIWEPLMKKKVKETCDLLIGGTPYLKPNEYYAGPPRRDIARAAIREGWKVELWGSGDWMDPVLGGPDLKKHYHGKYDYAARGTLWRRAKVNVNVHLRYGPVQYLNDRFFMLAGSGRAFVCDNQPGVKEFFPEVSYYKAGDLKDLMAKARELHQDPARRRELGRKLRKRILRSHTLAHRTDAMLATLGA